MRSGLKFIEIKKAVNQLLESEYPEYKQYGKEVREGYDTPAFFTEIIDKGSKAETKNFAKGGFTVKITYFQDEKNELDQLEKVDKIKDLFGLVFLVGNRQLTVGEFSSDYIGEYLDILQISIDIDYKENTQKTDTQEIATEANINITKG